MKKVISAPSKSWQNDSLMPRTNLIRQIVVERNGKGPQPRTGQRTEGGVAHHHVSRLKPAWAGTTAAEAADQPTHTRNRNRRKCKAHG